MRIVMAAHTFPRGQGDVVGAFIWRLAEALVDRGHTVTVVAPADRGDVGEPMLGKVRVRRFRYAPARHEVLAYQGAMTQAALSPMGAIAFARMIGAMGRTVAEEVRATSAHVIHAHWWIPGGLAVQRASRGGRPYVVTLQGSDVALAQRLPFTRRLMRSVLEPAARVTAVSSLLASEAAATLGVPANMIPLTPMPLALGVSADPDAARHGAIFVGRLTKEKGVSYLLDALALLKREGRPVDLTIVGDGPERPVLKAQARALGLNVTFTGFVAPELVAGHLRDKRVFVMPGADLGLGLVVAEALTQGVPVVATRSGSIPDLLYDPDAGMIVPPNNPASLAGAIRVVMAEERFRVGAWRAGRALAERRSPEKIAEQFEAIYSRTRSSRLSQTRVSGA